MDTPERFSTLPEATWPRLRGLLDVRAPGGEVINMTIGEPQHAFPDFVQDVLMAEMARFAKYPNNYGEDTLLAAISAWIGRRYGVAVGEDRIVNANGTREALYNAMMALCPERKAGQRLLSLRAPHHL